MQGLRLERCFLGDDLSLLARSLVQSRLQSLAFLACSQDELISLLPELGPGIAHMSQLQAFVCERPVNGEYDSVVLDDVLVRLVQGLAQCPRLKVVKFATPRMTTNL